MRLSILLLFPVWVGPPKTVLAVRMHLQTGRTNPHNHDPQLWIKLEMVIYYEAFYFALVPSLGRSSQNRSGGENAFAQTGRTNPYRHDAQLWIKLEMVKHNIMLLTRACQACLACTWLCMCIYCIYIMIQCDTFHSVFVPKTCTIGLRCTQGFQIPGTKQEMALSHAV